MNEQFENIRAINGEAFTFELKDRIDDKATAKFIETLIANKAVKVYFHYCDLDILTNFSYFKEDLMPNALRGNSSLKSIIFKGSSLNCALSKLIGSLINHPSLEHLTVRNYDKSSTDYKFFSALSTLLLLNNELKNLCFDHLELVNDISLLCNGIENSTTLKELEFWYMTISPENQKSLLNAIEKNKSLTNIRVEGCDKEFTEKLQKIMNDRKPKPQTVFFEQKNSSAVSSNSKAQKSPNGPTM